MIYDLKVILKCCRRSSHDLQVLCGWSWPLSGPSLAVLCHSWSLCWRSWPTLGTSVGGLGLLLGPACAVVAALGAFVGVFCHSWPTLGTSVGDLVPLLGPMLAVLAALGDFVGGLVPLLGPMLAVLGRSWDLCWRSWAVLGRKVALARAGRRSGKRSRRKVAQTRAGKRSGPLKSPKTPTDFFYRYVCV